MNCMIFTGFVCESQSVCSRLCVLSSVQPSYPVVLPIWHTEASEPFVVSLIEELNVSDEASAAASHPVSPTHDILSHTVTVSIINHYQLASTSLGISDVCMSVV